MKVFEKIRVWIIQQLGGRLPQAEKLFDEAPFVCNQTKPPIVLKAVVTETEYFQGTNVEAAMLHHLRDELYHALLQHEELVEIDKYPNPFGPGLAYRATLRILPPLGGGTKE